MNYCVVTTINHPTKAVERLHDHFRGNLIVVGDEKTPKDWAYKEAQYILDLPKEGWYEGYAPANHYARKNLGYLKAMSQGAKMIYESDDDNCPNDNWQIRTHKILASGINSAGWENVYRFSCTEWVNVYSFFCTEFIWPRGFSLKQIDKGYVVSENSDSEKGSSIQQGLANGDSDVDAIWRMLYGKKISFHREQSIVLYPHSWCPFNSQSTWWFPKAFPLMYLPVYATFRMTDIWRSFVAQRCLWELGEGIAFHSPAEVFQDRNEHNLMKDFEDEIPGYLNNDKIVEILSLLELKPGEENVCANMLTCYQALVDKGILPEKEILSLKAWIKDYESIARNMA